MDASQHFEEFVRVVYDGVRDPTDEMAELELRPLRKKTRHLKRLSNGNPVTCIPAKRPKLSFIVYVDDIVIGVVVFSRN